MKTQPPRTMLIGQAEEIDLVRPDVRRMLDNEGLYVGGDTKKPNVLVPLVSQGGKVYSMVIDTELNPERFLDTLTLKGPYTPDSPAPKPEGSELRAALLAILDAVDYTKGNCRMNEMVAAALPRVLITNARKALD